MCGGPTGAQTANQQAQADFYNKQISAYNTAYANYTQLQSAIQQQLQPILQAGPGQFGYTPAETAALRTQATEGTAQGYAAAQRALQQRIATQGGGTSNINLTGGPSQQLQAQLATSAAQESGQENLGITTSGYQQGLTNWQNALSGYNTLAQGWNPNAFAGQTISAGTAAGNEANTIAAQQNQMWGSILGAVGGIAGSAAGGWLSRPAAAAAGPGTSTLGSLGPGTLNFSPAVGDTTNYSQWKMG